MMLKHIPNITDGMFSLFLPIQIHLLLNFIGRIMA